MLKVGLTGGIGSGKSQVSALLAQRGAAVVDADVLAREVVEPGSAGLTAVVELFGAEVLRPDGTLDRAALGRRVFSRPEDLHRLNAVLHPLIAERTAARMRAAQAAGARVLVHDVALLVENGLASRYDVVVVVAAAPDTQLDRLVRLRGLSEQEARERIAAQAPLAERLAVATHVVRNDGSREELVAQVAALWDDLVARTADPTDPPTLSQEKPH